jgi:hypothetical protein
LFTDPEKTEIRQLVEAGTYGRTAIRAVESAMAVSTTEATRPVLLAVVHPILEADERAAAALGLLAGAIVARDDRAKIALRLQPRQFFRDTAMFKVAEAIAEATEAEQALTLLSTGLLPGDANIALALFNVRRMLVRLRGFDQGLPYLDPTAWTGIDPVLQRDGMTNLWRSGGQYLYDALAAILDAYGADPLALPAPLLVALKEILAYGWLIEDDLQHATARFLAIPWVSGESPLVAAQVNLLTVTSPRFQFMLTMVGQLLSPEAVLGRPLLQKKLIFAVAKGTDAWKRLDYAALSAGVLGGWVTGTGVLNALEGGAL